MTPPQRPSNRLIFGIDNGLDGGIVALNPAGTLVFKTPMPTIKLGKKRDYNMTDLIVILSPTQLTHVTVYIENATARPGQGVTSTFRTGYGFGLMLGLLAGLGVSYTVVSPRTWQNVMFKGLPAHAKPKEKSILAAQRLWPTVTWTKSARASKPHDGTTDAALIAEYGRRTLFHQPKQGDDECEP